MNRTALAFLLTLIASLPQVAAADKYQRPSADEALAFLQSLPPLARRVEGKEQFLNEWRDRTAQDIKTMTEIAPGGHPAGSKGHLRIDSDNWKYFTAFESIETAKLWEIDGANDQAFYHLGHLPQSVKYLYVELADVSDEGVHHLQNLANLEYLGIGWSENITDGALANMAKIPSLQEVLVSGCKGVKGSGAAHLAGLKNLKKLQIADTSVTDASLGAFVKLNIEELDLSSNALTADGLKQLLGTPSNLPKLKKLLLRKVALSGEELDTLRSIRPELTIEN